MKSLALRYLLCDLSIMLRAGLNLLACTMAKCLHCRQIHLTLFGSVRLAPFATSDVQSKVWQSLSVSFTDYSNNLHAHVLTGV